MVSIAYKQKEVDQTTTLKTKQKKSVSYSYNPSNHEEGEAERLKQLCLQRESLVQSELYIDTLPLF